jgi:P-type Ca2+ transporter type 2C
MELLKALSAVSLDGSLYRVQPWKNPWLLPGVLVPFLLHLAVINIKPLANIFGLAPLSWTEWKAVLAFASPIVILEEVLKYIGRHKGELKEAAYRRLREARAHAPTAPVMPPPMF